LTFLDHCASRHSDPRIERVPPSMCRTVHVTADTRWPHAEAVTAGRRGNRNVSVCYMGVMDVTDLVLQQLRRAPH